MGGVADRGTQAAGGGCAGRGGAAALPDEELSQELARAGEQVLRLVIAREEVARVLEEPAAVEPQAGPAGEPGPAPPAGVVTVPPWREGAEASMLPRS